MIAPAWITQPSPSCAPGSTIAVGCIDGFIAWGISELAAQRENELASARALFRGGRALGGPGAPGRLHPVGEQVELRVLQEVVVLEDADHLQGVALSVVAVG